MEVNKCLSNSIQKITEQTSLNRAQEIKKTKGKNANSYIMRDLIVKALEIHPHCEGNCFLNHTGENRKEIQKEILVDCLIRMKINKTS